MFKIHSFCKLVCKIQGSVQFHVLLLYMWKHDTFRVVASCFSKIVHFSQSVVFFLLHFQAYSGNSVGLKTCLQPIPHYNAALHHGTLQCASDLTFFHHIGTHLQAVSD